MAKVKSPKVDDLETCRGCGHFYMYHFDTGMAIRMTELPDGQCDPFTDHGCDCADFVPEDNLAYVVWLSAKRALKKAALAFSVALLLAFPALSADYYAQMGLGTDGRKQDKYDQIRHFELGQQRPIWKLLDQRIGFGGWFDNTKGHDTKNSLYGTYYLGLEPRIKVFYVHWFSGLSYISATDDSLPTNFQFAHTFGIGVKDLRGVRVGLYASHFSNAGIKEPNYGRNFYGINLQLKLK